MQGYGVVTNGPIFETMGPTDAKSTQKHLIYNGAMNEPNGYPKYLLDVTLLEYWAHYIFAYPLGVCWAQCIQWAH